MSLSSTLLASGALVKGGSCGVMTSQGSLSCNLSRQREIIPRWLNGSHGLTDKKNVKEVKHSFVDE